MTREANPAEGFVGHEVTARAHGRVNLIGEHTDYNGGFVLPTPIPRFTTVALSARKDRLVRVSSVGMSTGARSEYALGQESATGDWTDYVQGVTWVLAQEHDFGGFDASIRSDIPMGHGLASSAALAVALQRAIRERFGLTLDDLQIARNGLRVESEFVGPRVGIMDPLVSSVGRPGYALFVDTLSLETRQIPIPAEIELVVVDSGVAHRHATGEYNRRRQECEEAAARLGVSSLRDVEPGDLAKVAQLPEPLRRRARHVVTENARVLEAVEALESGDAERLGRLVAETHRSLSEDFEVSTPVIDALVRDLSARPGVLGARITGGGFGGAVLAIARAGTGRAAADSVLGVRGTEGDAATIIVRSEDGGRPPSPSQSSGLDGRQPPLFGAPILGGFECSTHRLRSGRRLDLIAATRHDEFARLDYRRLRTLGIRTARDGVRWTLVEDRPGRYDFSSVRPMMEAAREEGIRLIWDLLHFGWPDHVDVMSPEFPERFGEFVGRFAEVLEEEGDSEPAVCPVNEISFLAFAGGDAGFFNPFLHGRGNDLKRQLVRAAITACAQMRAIRPRARLVHIDPVIHIEPHPDRPEDRVPAERHREAQFDAWDMIAGRREPELGGRPEFLDVIGVNYYIVNQWYFPGGPSLMIQPSSPHRMLLRDLLLAVHHRYGRPIFIAETGIEDAARPTWLAHVGDEVRAAMRAGADLHGVCLYPILNHPGWDDDRHCHNGLWDYPDEAGHREAHRPLAEEIVRQQRAFELAERGVPDELGAAPLLRSLEQAGASMAEKTEEGREA